MAFLKVKFNWNAAGLIPGSSRMSFRKRSLAFIGIYESETMMGLCKVRFDHIGVCLR